MKNIIALVAVLFAGVAFAGDAPKAQTPAPAQKAVAAKACNCQPATVLVEKTKYVKETKLVPVTTVKKVTEVVAVPCTEVAVVRGRLFDGHRLRRAAAVATCGSCN